ncbi:MAG TPA: hypothetical protein PLF54_04065 [Deltaproteobacteria bacterium]|jgi:hypothetical protein|nr:hypothetical protein [Deltaproteobacteria bacterium]HQJ08154.1 hypothetical protein [Deltaproteobacteria bacterium]
MDRKLSRMILMFAGICICMIMLAACSNSSHDDESPVSQEQTSADNQPGNQPNDQPATPDQPSVAPGRLDLYSFTITSGSTTPILTMTQSQGQSQRSAEIRSNIGTQMGGTFAPTTGMVTLAAGTSLKVTLNNFWGVASPKDLIITVTQPITFLTNVPAADELFPSQGSFAVIYEGNFFNVTFTDTSPDGGVRMMLHSDAVPVDFDAQTFEGLLDAPDTPIWQQKASLAFIILEMLSDQVGLASGTSDIIDTNHTALMSGGLTTAGTEFVPTGQASPFPPTGSRTLTWTDTASDGQVGAGDSFLWMFTWDWDNGPGALSADLTNGQVGYAGYIRMTESRNGQDVITGYGFQTGGQNPGGATYTDLTQVEVDEFTPGTITFNANAVYTLNGSFDILFAEAAASGM